MAYSKSELLKLAATGTPLVAQLAVELLEAKNEVAACCDEIKKLTR